MAPCKAMDLWENQAFTLSSHKRFKGSEVASKGEEPRDSERPAVASASAAAAGPIPASLPLTEDPRVTILSCRLSELERNAVALRNDLQELLQPGTKAKKRKAVEEALRQDPQQQLVSPASSLVPSSPAAASPPMIPEIAHEDIYRSFLNGRLVYRPNGGNDDTGKIELRIADLANPLMGTFNLSRCGDAERYLTISTGYHRKSRIIADKGKLKIWLTPRFLVEKDLNSTAKHFTPIMGEWDPATGQIGMMFTGGEWTDLGWYFYATDINMNAHDEKNLYKIWLAARPHVAYKKRSPKHHIAISRTEAEKISFSF